MADYIVEKDFVSNGYRCVVIRFNDTYMRHRCGYVGVPETHPLFGCNYYEHSEVLGNSGKDLKQETIGKRGIFSVFCWDGKRVSPDIYFDVHGSITYSGSSDKGYPVETDEPTWWFGYDCAHYGDDEDGGKFLAYCVQECENLARQLREVDNAKSS